MQFMIYKFVCFPLYALDGYSKEQKINFPLRVSSEIKVSSFSPCFMEIIFSCWGFQSGVCTLFRDDLHFIITLLTLFHSVDLFFYVSETCFSILICHILRCHLKLSSAQSILKLVDTFLNEEVTNLCAVKNNH